MSVKVEALKHHTYNNQAYGPGDTYEIDDDVADSVAAQGMAKRLDVAAPPAPTPSQPVEPMSTANSGLAHGKK